ncbi:hypothetical protein [Tardiphaga sp. P5_C7]
MRIKRAVTQLEGGRPERHKELAVNAADIHGNGDNHPFRVPEYGGFANLIDRGSDERMVERCLSNSSRTSSRSKEIAG